MAITILFASSKSTSAVAKGDVPIRDRLATTLGHTLSYSDVDGTPNGSATFSAGQMSSAVSSASADMVVLPSSVVLDSIRSNLFLGLGVPVLSCEAWLWDEHGFAAPGTGRETSSTHTRVTVVASSHPAAGGLSGDVTVLSLPGRMNFVLASGLPAGATPIAHIAGEPEKVVAWVIEKGGRMADGRSAPARRGGFLFIYDTAAHATGECWTLFDALVGWLANETSAVEPSGIHLGGSAHTGSMLAVDDSTAPELSVEVAWGVPWDRAPSDGVGLDRFEFDRLGFDDSSLSSVLAAPLDVLTTVSELTDGGVSVLADDPGCVLLVDPSGFYDAEQRAVLNSSLITSRTALAVGLGSAGCAGPIFGTDKDGGAMWVNQTSQVAYVRGTIPALTSASTFTVEGTYGGPIPPAADVLLASFSGGAYVQFESSGEITFFDGSAADTSASTVATLLSISDDWAEFEWRAAPAGTSLNIDVRLPDGSWVAAVSGATIAAVSPAGQTLYCGSSSTTKGLRAKVRRLTVRDGGTGATKVAEFLPSMFVGGNRADGDTAVDAHGVTWTVERPAATTDMPRVMVGGAEQFISLPGKSGEYVSTPDTAANSITGDLDIRASAALADWSSAFQTLVSKWLSTGGQQSWIFRMTSVGNLQFVWSTTGSSVSAATSTAPVTFTDFATGFVRCTVDVDNGSSNADIRFYTSPDGVAWTQLGSVVNPGSTISFFDSTAVLAVGAHDNGTGNPTTGSVFWAEVYDGIDGTLVERIDAAEASPNSTTWTSSTSGATVTVNKSSSAQYHATVVPANTTIVQSDGVNDFAQVCGDDTVSDFVPAIGLSMIADFVVTSGAGSFGRIMSKGTSAQIGILRNSTLERIYGRITDGTNTVQIGDNVNNITYNDRTMFVAAFGSSDHESFVDGASDETASTAVTAFSPTAALTFFRDPAGGGLGAFDLYGAAVTTRRVSETLTTSPRNRGSLGGLEVDDGTGFDVVNGPRVGQYAVRLAGTTGAGSDVYAFPDYVGELGWTFGWSQRYAALRGSGAGSRIINNLDLFGGFSAAFNEVGDLTFTWMDLTTTEQSAYLPRVVAIDGRWQHVTLRYNDSALNVGVYVDGALVATINTPKGVKQNTSGNPPKFFEADADTTREIDIDVAEMVFVEDVLTDTQIAEIAASSLNQGGTITPTQRIELGDDLDLRVKVQVDSWPAVSAPLIQQWGAGDLTAADTITFVSASESSDNDIYGATVSVGAPASLADDDLMIAWCMGDLPSSGWAAPAGWTEIVNVTSPATGRDRGVALFYKVASSESGGYTFTYDTGQERAAGILVFRNVDTSTPFDVAYSPAHLSESENDESPMSPPIETVTDGAMVVALSAMTDDDVSTSAPPVGYTMGAEKFGAGFNHRQFGMAYRLVPTAGIESPGVWPHVGNGTGKADSTQVTVALRPATSGSAGERAFRFTIAEDDLGFEASADGDATLLDHAAGGTAPAYMTDGGAQFWVRVTCDADNGASGSDTKFWTRQNDTDTWTQLGVTRTGSGLALYDSAQPITVGSADLGGVSVLEVEICDAIDGDLIAEMRAADAIEGDDVVASKLTTWNLNGGLTVTPGNDWTDITSDVRYASGIHIERGRSRDLGETQPGRGQLTVTNRARAYEPEHTTGIYYPNVRPMTHIRIRATWWGRTYGLFRGFVRRWVPQYPGHGHDAVTHLELVDAGVIAARTAIDGGYLHPNIADIAGSLHFPLSERAGTDYGAETLTPTTRAVYIGDQLQAADSFHPDGSKDRYIQLAGDPIEPNVAAVGFDGDLTVVAWVRDLGSTTNPTILNIRETSSSDVTLTLTVELDGGITVLWHNDGAGAAATVVATSDLMDGEWHMLAVTRTGSGSSWTCSAYVDGVAVATDVAGPVETPGSSADVIEIGDNLIGNIGEVSIAPIALSDVAIAEIYDAWLNLFPQQSPDERIRKILAGYLRVPASQLSLDVAGSSMSEADLTGGTISEPLRDAVTTELGLLFWDGDGLATFHSRARRNNTTTAEDIGYGTNIPIADIGFADGADVRRNVAVVSYGNGNVSAIDEDAIERDGEIRESLTLQVESEGYAQAVADHIVTSRANQSRRIDTVVISATRDPANMAVSCLSRELSDLLAVHHLPVDDDSTPTEIVFTGFVEHLSWDINGDKWQQTLRLSPEGFSRTSF